MPWRENEGKANNVNGSTPEDVRFIYVYRLAIDARPKRGDGVAGRKYPSLLEDFQTGRSINVSQETSASSARGFSGFCLISPQSSVLSVQSVKSVVKLRRNILRTGSS